jgi:hypothetical protein
MRAAATIKAKVVLGPFFEKKPQGPADENAASAGCARQQCATRMW